MSMQVGLVNSQSLFRGLLVDRRCCVMILKSWASKLGFVTATLAGRPGQQYLTRQFLVHKIHTFTKAEFPRGSHPITTTESFTLVPYHLHNGNVSLGGVAYCVMALIARSFSGLGIPFHLHRMYLLSSTVVHIYRPLTVA